MKTKHILIAVVIIAIVAVVGGYLLLNGSPTQQMSEHSTIILSKSAYMEVPVNPNATSKADKKGIFYYKDNDGDINITSCSNLSADSSSKSMKKLKDSIATGSKKITEDNIVIYEKDGVYSVFVKNTEYNDTLLIQSSDKNLLIECWNTVKYHDPTDKIKFDNGTDSGSVVNAVEKTESAVQKSTDTSDSSSSVNDGSRDLSTAYSGKSKSYSSSDKVNDIGTTSEIFDYDT